MKPRCRGSQAEPAKPTFPDDLAIGWLECTFSRRCAKTPGFFRTELLTNDSTTYAQPTIDDYAERTKEIVSTWKNMDGKQSGDSAKLADALVKLVALKEPPTRFAAGADAMQTFEAKAKTLLAQAQAHHELSVSLAYDDA